MASTSPTGVDAEEPVGAGTHDSGNAPTSTNALFGEGRPRLIFKVGDTWDGSAPREFDLLMDTTRIGSADDMDLVLAGLEPFHAEIKHTDDDEYVLSHVTTSDEQNSPVLEEGVIPGEGILRTGSPVELGDWSMSYYRDERADHGRPGGGRAGGEGEHQPPQEG